jgi:2'-5' RNA ligase
MSQISKEIFLKKLRRDPSVGEITEAEMREWLPHITSAESWAIFDELYNTWQRSNQETKEEEEARRAEDLESHIKVRKAFEALARHKGLI